MGRMEALTDSEIKAIERLALNIRRTIIEMLVAAGSGHTAGPLGMADVFAALYFRVEECLTLRKFGSRLQGHPERERLPGLETTSGPLGSGLSQATGIAYA